jgi:hypothetical protein
MPSLTTIFRLLVVALLVALAGGQVDSRHVAVHASQIAVAQTALSSAAPTTTPRTWRVHRPSPSMRELAESELEGDSDELEGDEEGSPASTRPSVRIELQAHSKDVAGSGWDAPLSPVVSHWMPTGHPRGPPGC